jgi:predicted Zn-dependent protease with MMP-like domain
VRRAAKVAPDVPVYRAFEVQILFEKARFEEARRVLEQAALMDSESAHAVYHLALVLERLGEDEEAERAFRRANALDPDHYALPVRVQDAVFQRASEDALANLPRSIREAVENVPILVHELPEEDLLHAENVSPTILGLFTEQARDVNRVILFKKNLEKMCRTRAELVEQIQTTLQHEIGHYLGLDDDDLERIGLA